MKNNYASERAAEMLIERYLNSVELTRQDRPWIKYVRHNRFGKRAVRLAGYLTGQGIFK